VSGVGSTEPPGSAGAGFAGAGAGISAEPSFEEARTELEEIVARLERGDVAVDQALELWRRGEELYRLCLAKLDVVAGRVEELAAGSGDDNAAAT
jgi:exodeoxyribonuclease VII small subunit